MMDKRLKVNLVFGCLVQKWMSKAYNTLGMDDYWRLMTTAESQVALWEEGVRDVRIHDTVMAVLGSL